jgi:hypothetical protein
MKHLNTPSAKAHPIRDLPPESTTPAQAQRVLGGAVPAKPTAATWTHDDEGPKETVTFSYGG